MEDEEEISSGILEETIDGVWFLQVKLSFSIVSVSSPCLVFYLGLAKLVEELKEDFFFYGKSLKNAVKNPSGCPKSAG